MRKKIGRFFIILTIILSILCNINIVRADLRKADVGSFESYSSSSSSSGSSSSSSSWGSGSSSSYSGSSSYGDVIDLSLDSLLGKIGVILLVIAYFGVAFGGMFKKKENNNYGLYPKTILATPDTLREEDTYNRIRNIDETFKKEEFIEWSKELFVKLQQAWTDRDWEKIRPFETNELFEQHKNQLQGYINNNQINVMDKIRVNFANLYDFKQEGDKDILVVRLNSTMLDYIIDATTKQILRGDKYTERTNTYLLTFTRKTGITSENVEEIKTTNCPNCGAVTQITTSGKCEYCGSVITTGVHDWALANLERERV